MTQQVIVVGGGIAGLYAALLQRKLGHEVVLVEAEEKVGGLLNSWRNPQGDVFDFGTHFIAGTLDPAIDAEILPKDWTCEWQEFPNEVAGNLFQGKLTDDCIFVDAKKLPADTYREAMLDFLEAPGAQGDEAHLAQQLEREFGAGITRHLYTPALGKLFGVSDLAELSTDAHLRFAMKRIVAFSHETTLKLKSVPTYDRKLAFHRYSIGAAARPQYYPHTGGAEEWIKQFERRLRAMGVRILTGKKIVSVFRQGSEVSGIKLHDGEQFSCQRMIWTVPIPALLKAADIPFKGSPPRLRRTSVVNLVFDQAPTPQCHFFFNYDPNFLSFRVTLYSNLQSAEAQKTNRHRVTVEVLSAEAPVVEALIGKVQEELIGSVFPRETRCLYATAFEIPNGFPVLDHAFAAAKKSVIETAETSFSNVVLVGRTNTAAWFMVDVFRDVYAKCSR